MSIPSARSLLFAFCLLGTPFATGCMAEQGNGASHPMRDTITVVGNGEVKMKPDIARLNVGVEARAPTVAEATRRNAEQMSRLVGALKSASIADKDIQTSNYSIYFDAHPQPPPFYGYAPAPHGSGSIPPAAPTPPPPSSASPPRKGPAPTAAIAPAPDMAPPMTQPGVFVVSNNVSITVRDLARVGAILDTAVASGGNAAGGISFDVDKKDAIESQLREKSIADAKHRAEELAKLSGLGLGPIIAVSEVISHGGSPPRPMPMAAMGKGGFDSAATPIESGELSFSGQIEIIYAIQ